MEDTPEAASPLDVPLAHKRDWFGIVVAMAALGTSIASIWIAVDNANSMDRLVQASSWPYLELDSSNVDDDGNKIVTLTLTNTGIGPLRLESFGIKRSEQAVRHLADLLRSSYDPEWTEPTTPEGWEAIGSITTSTPRNTVLAPGGSVLVYSVPRVDSAPALWEAVNKARFDHRYHACYCSVFDECWTTDFSNTRPESIDACPVTKDDWQG